MNTQTIPTDAKRELGEAVARLINGVRDPASVKKACQEMDRMREETRARIGTVEVAVDLVLDARDR